MDISSYKSGFQVLLNLSVANGLSLFPRLRLIGDNELSLILQISFLECRSPTVVTQRVYIFYRYLLLLYIWGLFQFSSCLFELGLGYSKQCMVQIFQSVILALYLQYTCSSTKICILECMENCTGINLHQTQPSSA